MTITEKRALKIWQKKFGNAKYVEDFSGTLMCRDAYGNRNYYIIDHGKRIYCGWNIHHILPKKYGGSNAIDNLTCTNIITNETAGNKITFRINDGLYQVKKNKTTNDHEIIRLQ